MSLAFACPCGQRYKVGEELARKVVRCKQCGQSLRIPAAPAATIPAPSASPSPAPALIAPDVYGLDEELSRASADLAEEPVLTPVRRASAGKVKESTSKTTGGLGGFLEAMPRGEDLRYPLAGLVALVLGLAGLAVGGLFGQVLFVFLALAAPICLLWAGVAALVTSFKQGIGNALALVPGLVASLVFCLTLLATKPIGKGPLAAGLFAVAGLAGFLRYQKRGEPYRRPVALGAMGMLFMIAFAMMMGVVRQRLATMVIRDVNDTAVHTRPGAQNGPAVRTPQAAPPQSLVDARRGFQSKLVPQASHRRPVATPPSDIFQLVKYDSPVGKLPAYLTPDPGDGRPHPAIVWITGGDCNTIDAVWEEADPENDQTAAAYRKAGIIMMFPSLRGGNTNPGNKEGFLGEVDDVIAATKYLARQPYVDPKRIFLGGHSTGGTLAMLVAESSDLYHAVFGFGPVALVSGYPGEYTPFDTANPMEIRLRSPGYWLHSVQSPTFIIEGEQGNADHLKVMDSLPKGHRVQFFLVNGANHFNVLAPTNALLARKILQSDDPSFPISINSEELNRAFAH